MSDQSTHVLVVGAGPAGLTAGCELARRGARVTVLEALARPSQAAKALLVWPAALRIAGSFGLGARARAQGADLRRAVFHSNGRPLASLDLAAAGGPPLLLAQRDTERLLAEALAGWGAPVRRGARLIGFSQDADRVIARVEQPDGGVRTVRADWLVGADGMDSTVRSCLGVRFPGSSPAGRFLLAEGRLDGPGLDPGGAHYYTGPHGVLGVIPLPGGGYRASGALPPRTGRLGPEVVQRLLDEQGPGGLRFTEPSWLSSFALHRRLADRLRVGRVFLVGDAAHVCPPLGGHGLNLGMQDARDLAARLAAVAVDGADPRLLDGYARRRRAEARRVLRAVAISTRMWTLTGAGARAARDAALGALEFAGLFDTLYGPLFTGRRG